MQSRYLFYILLLFLLLSSCSNGYLEEKALQSKPIDEMEIQAKEWLDALCGDSFKGRKAGSEGNQLAYEYISRVLISMGYFPETQLFETESGAVLRNIIVTIPGLSDSTIVIGAHYDGANQSDSNKQYEAANDNASGTVALMIFLKHLSTKPINSDRTVVCCFWDGEESLEGKAFNGSTYFVQNFPKELLPIVLHYQNLDTIGHNHDGKNEIYLEYLGCDRIAHWAYKLSQNGRFVYHIAESTFFNSDYAPFSWIGVSFLNYHDHFHSKCENPNHSTNDIKEVISLSRLVNIANNVRETIESY